MTALPKLSKGRLALLIATVALALAGDAVSASATIRIDTPRLSGPGTKSFVSGVKGCLAAGLNADPEVAHILSSLANSPLLHEIRIGAPIHSVAANDWQTTALAGAGVGGRRASTVTIVPSGQSEFACDVLIHELAHGWHMDRGVFESAPLCAPGETQDDVYAVRVENRFRAATGQEPRTDYSPGCELPANVIAHGLPVHPIDFSPDHLRPFELRHRVTVGREPPPSPTPATSVHSPGAGGFTPPVPPRVGATGQSEPPPGDVIPTEFPLVLIVVIFGDGTVHVSPPDRTYTAEETREEFLATNGLTVTLLATPAAGSYFAGWQRGSECARKYVWPDRAATYSCTIDNPGGLREEINMAADFQQCPPAGTTVADPAAAICPGVRILPGEEEETTTLA